jgi:site-specific DNA recombinase
MVSKAKKNIPAPQRRRAAIYCRVSTFDQNRGDYSSLEDQEARLRRAAEQEGYEIYRVYKEVASSANMEREQLKKMLGDLKEFNAIFVTKLDRLSRSMHDWCLINERMDQHGVALVCTTQKIDTGTPLGRFFRDLLMLFAQFEREMIAERVYEKMAEHARLGKYSGGRPILGYDVVERKLVVNVKEAPTVRALFDKYLELGSIARTARWANLQGYRTKHVRYKDGREVGSKKFKRADLQRMLGNITYIGKVRFDDMEFEGEHEGIIPEKKFLEVQNLLAAKRDKPRRGDQKQQDTLLLGILKCGFCGGAYTSSFVNKKGANGKTKRYYYYKCTKKIKDEAGACPAADLRADVVDAVFTGFFRKLSQQPDKLEAVLKAAQGAFQEGAGPIEKERDRLSKELAQVEGQALALVDRLADPELAQIDAVKVRLTELDQRQRTLKAQIAELTLQLRDRRDQVISIDEIKAAYRQFDELWGELDFEERRYAIRLLVREAKMRFKKKEEDGTMQIEAWGRSPTPLKIRLHDFRNGKLRNQDVWYTRRDSNPQPSVPKTDALSS